jgi:hypothetical protein
MKTLHKTSKILGVAFLLQFFTSLTSAVFLRPKWNVPGDIRETMIKIAANPGWMQATILLDMLTALGVIFLGVMLFLTLRKQSEKMAMTAAGFYILEGALLAASRAQAFSLMGISQEYVASGYPPSLEFLGTLTFELMEFVGSTLHMLVFCFGAIIFYSLLYRSALVPKPLSLWGLLTVFPCLIGTLMVIFGYQPPFMIYLPYVPFEFVIGIWILVKGIPERTEIKLIPEFASVGGNA